MSRTRVRLEKLEATAGPSSRVIVVHGHSDAEHTAKIEALKASGAASERDLFVCIMRFSEPGQGSHHEAV
jgi:hypothetical protein